MGVVQENIRRLRLEKGLTYKALGELVGKSGSSLRGYESGKSDITLSTLEVLAKALGVSLAALVSLPEEKRAPEKKAPVEISIFQQEDRLLVAQLLIKNGYTVGQGKRKKTPTGKVMDYYLKVYGSGDDFSLDE